MKLCKWIFQINLQVHGRYHSSFLETLDDRNVITASSESITKITFTICKRTQVCKCEAYNFERNLKFIRKYHSFEWWEMYNLCPRRLTLSMPILRYANLRLLISNETWNKLENIFALCGQPLPYAVNPFHAHTKISKHWIRKSIVANVLAKYFTKPKQGFIQAFCLMSDIDSRKIEISLKN